MGSPTAPAQDYPTRPVRLVVPIRGLEQQRIIGRALAQRMGHSLGSSDRGDRAGPAETWALIRRQVRPDGYTLLVATNGRRPSRPTSSSWATRAARSLAGRARCNRAVRAMVHPSLPAGTCAS